MKPSQPAFNFKKLLLKQTLELLLSVWGHANKDNDNLKRLSRIEIL